MNSELDDLLRQAGATTGPYSSARMVVLNNCGRVPRPPGHDDRSGQKNFKILLLGQDGRPAYVVSCADASDRLIEHEYHIAATLCRFPELQGLLPLATTVSSRALRVLVAHFVPGTRFDHLEPGMSISAWRPAVRRIIDASAEVCRRAQVAFPEITAGRGTSVTLRDEAESDMAILRDGGFTASALRAIDEVLRDAGPLPRTLQYGDLWAANVLVRGNSCCLLDLAEFGRVHVPMFDVFHLVGHSLRSSLLPIANGLLGPSGEPARMIAREYAARSGLDASQCAGTFLYYLMSMAAFRLRPGVAPENRIPHVRNLVDAIELRRSGVDFRALLSPDKG